MSLLVVFFLLSIVFSFLCSIWEAVLLSISPSYVITLRNDGKSGLGDSIEALKEEIDRPLSAILSLNTIAHTVGAIGVGAQAGHLYATRSFSLGPIHLSYEAIVAGLMTMAILILSEIIPKTIGANHWKKLTPFTIRSVSLLMIGLAPLVWLSQWITQHLKKDAGQSVLSRADFAAYAEIGAESGAINESESRIIDNLLELRSLQARDIMTPRSVMTTVEESETVARFFASHKASPFSRIPIYSETLDHIRGFVLKNDILLHLAEDKDDTKLKDLKRPIETVNANQSLPVLFDTLLGKRSHVAIVVDDFGSVLGLVTQEDVMETLLGIEIVDETDQTTDLQALARQKWRERAKNVGLQVEED